LQSREPCWRSPCRWSCSPERSGWSPAPSGLRCQPARQNPRPPSGPCT